MNGKIAAVLATFVVSIWLFWLLFLLFGTHAPVSSSSLPFDKLGQFGDSFGALASLMSTLALVGALYSIHLQNKTYDRQQFESNFYTILNSVKEKQKEIHLTIIGKPIAENLSEKAIYKKLIKSLRETKHEFKGPDAFRVILYRIRNEIGSDGYSDSKSIARKYRRMISGNILLKNYFRILYHLYAMLDRSAVDNKEIYSRIIRAHLSDPEVCLIAYNCSIGDGRFKFKSLVERYSTLHNMKNDYLDPYEESELKFFRRKISDDAFRFDDIVPVTY